MFERFTERARQVVVLAQDESRLLKHNYIGTEHLLLGLLREEEGLAARVLESLDVTVEEVRAQVTRIVGPGDEVTSGQIPFTPRAKRVLELSLREALSLGHDYIGTEHILLGLAREGEGVANHILADLGTDADRLRNEVIRLLGAAEQPVSEPQLSTPPIAAELIEELRRLDDQKEQAIGAQEFDRAASLRDRRRRLHNVAAELQRAWERREEERPTFPPRRAVAGPASTRVVATSARARGRTISARDVLLFVSFALGALVFGIGLLVGWLIWG
jgi:ATP-dependent Clp protease ATP-binding subunit ClpA